MKKLLFIITFILMIPAHAFAANLSDISPQQFIENYDRQVKRAFKGLYGPYLKYMYNFVIYDVQYIPEKNGYAAIISSNNKVNIIWIENGSNNGIKTIIVSVSDNYTDCQNILYHHMHFISHALNMYGHIDLDAIKDIIQNNRDSYTFSYNGNQYMITSRHGTFSSSNTNFSALIFTAY